MTSPSTPLQPLGIGWLCVGALAASLALVFWPEGLSFELGASEGLASFSEGLPWWKAGGILFLGGLLTALTPCVYPLIPITVGVLGASQARSKLQAVALSTAYILGMGLVFSLAGMAAALSGQAFGFLLSNRWVLLGLSGFMALLAASMLGTFELRLPFSWTQRLGKMGGGGSLWGALFMGGAAGLLAAPCTGPILSGLLTYIAQQQAFWLGAIGLFIYAMGIGLPFFIVGVFAIKLPKGGKWMVGVKYFFGLLLAALALSYLKEAWPSFEAAVVWMTHTLGRKATLLVAGGLVFFAIFLGGIRRNREKAPSGFSTNEASANPSKASLLGMLLLAILLRFELPPAATLREAPLVWSHRFSAQNSSMAVFEEALLQAQKQGHPVLIDFFAQWCTACKELEKISFADAKVQQEAERFVRIKVDATKENKNIEALYARYSVRGLPTVIFLNPQGELLSKPRVEGFLGPKELLRQMQKVR
ncbi:MAG: thioredoxin family protein [Cystobacterineae bacterium]|nr:thioredoxin family protein [Cystobacterineae bacterium]